MPVITPREQRLLGTGAAGGLRDGIETVLKLHSGAGGAALTDRVQQVPGSVPLEQFLKAASETAFNPGAIRASLPLEPRA